MKTLPKQRYRVGGVSKSRLERIIAEAKREGAEASLVRKADNNRVSPQGAEFTIDADQQALLAIMATAGASAGACMVAA